MSSLALIFRKGSTSLAQLIVETCKAILTELESIHMGAPSHLRLKQVRCDFSNLLQLPNCIGALDDMVCKIRRPKDNQSNYFSNKKYCHVVLQGMADAHYKLLSVGVIGEEKYGSTFGGSDLYHQLQRNKLRIANRGKTFTELNNLSNFVYATRSYPLKKYMITPYKERTIDEKELHLNNELLKAKNCIHSAFGLMRMKYKLLTQTIECSNVNKCKLFIKTICLLHNIVRDLDGDNDPAYISIKDSKKNGTYSAVTIMEIEFVEVLELERELPVILFANSCGTIESQVL